MHKGSIREVLFEYLGGRRRPLPARTRGREQRTSARSVVPERFRDRLVELVASYQRESHELDGLLSCNRWMASSASDSNRRGGPLLPEEARDQWRQRSAHEPRGSTATDL